MPQGIWENVFYGVWALLLTEGAILVLLSRQVRRLNAERGPGVSSVGLALGTAVPEIEVDLVSGERVVLGGRSSRRRLLLFVSPGCPGCRVALREAQRARAVPGQILLICSANSAKTRDMLEEYQIQLPALADSELKLWKRFMISGVPFAMALDEEGRVTDKAFAGLAEQFSELLTSQDAERSRQAVGLASEPQRASAGAGR